MQNAAHLLGLRLPMVGAARQSDIGPAFAEMAQHRAGVAKALGLTVQKTLLVFADEVIE